MEPTVTLAKISQPDRAELRKAYERTRRIARGSKRKVWQIGTNMDHQTFERLAELRVTQLGRGDRMEITEHGAAVAALC